MGWDWIGWVSLNYLERTGRQVQVLKATGVEKVETRARLFYNISDTKSEPTEVAKVTMTPLLLQIAHPSLDFSHSINTKTMQRQT